MKTTVIALFFFVSVLSFAQTNENLEFYPINTNNYFEYVRYYQSDIFSPVDSTCYSISITGDTVLSNGKKYKVLLKSNIDKTNKKQIFERVDTATGYIFRFDDKRSFENNEYKIENLYIKVGGFSDCSRSGQSSFPSRYRTIFLQEISEKILGVDFVTRVYDDRSTIPNLNYSLAKGLGYFRASSWEMGGWWERLVYAVIDGKSYGKKIIVNVEKAEIPTSFSLSQNYPNPFNPETTIEFSIPNSQFATLKVYDVLGREVAALVNEVKTPGNYFVKFNARHLERSREIPSGVYFCRLSANNFSKTIKLSLVK